MDRGDKSCIIKISQSDYLDLAAGMRFTKQESYLKPATICKARSWTSEYREVWVQGQPNDRILEFKEVFSEKVHTMPSKIRVFENPLVSLDTVKMQENHWDVSRSVSLITNPGARSMASKSTDTFTSISTCIEMKTSTEITKLPFKKLSQKYTKYNKKDILEMTELSTMSPVEKRKMSKASEMIVEHDTLKSSIATGGQNKRASVVFKMMEEGKEDVKGDEDDEFPPRPSHHCIRRISEFGACGPRPSIFSVFSQVASRSHRPSIFSRLSDFSLGSFSSNYSWNFRKMFVLIFVIFSFFIIVSFLLVLFWPKFEHHGDKSHTLRHIQHIKETQM